MVSSKSLKVREWSISLVRGREVSPWDSTQPPGSEQLFCLSSKSNICNRANKEHEVMFFLIPKPINLYEKIHLPQNTPATSSIEPVVKSVVYWSISGHHHERVQL